MTRTLLFHWRKLPVVLLSISVLSGCAEINQAFRYYYPPLNSFPVRNMTKPETKPAIPAVKPKKVSIQSHNFILNGKDSIIGDLATVSLREGDTLPDIARHFGVGFQHIAEANSGVDLWVPQQGVRVVLPLKFTLPDAKPIGVVINLAAMRLFYFKGEKQSAVSTWPIGIGRESRSTPLGIMAIARKMRRPTWYVPESIRRTHAEQGDPLPAAVPPGPDNPLGDFALYLSKPAYLIHGTNKPFSIGLRATNGCIRLYPEDIEHAYGEIPIGTPVNIVNQPYLLGWLNGVLYLEAHKPYEEVNAGAERKNLIEKLRRMDKESQHKIDWLKVEETLNDGHGIPVPIFKNTPRLEGLLAAAPHLERPARLFGQPEKVEPGKAGWFIRAEATDEYIARKLAAQLNHFGPRIPAHAIVTGQGHHVVGGPFAQEQAAHKARRTLSRDFDIKSDIVRLGRLDSGQPVQAGRDKPIVITEPVKPARVEPGKPSLTAEPVRPIEALKPAVSSETAKSTQAKTGKPVISTEPATPAKTVKPDSPFERKRIRIMLRLPKTDGP
jgi:L,D-transpeptidase ErfK/SrfK